MPRDGFGGCWFKCHPLLSKQINHKKAWCNWLLVTQHSVAFIKGCCTMWLRRAGFLLLMCKARQKKKNPSADSKHSPILRLGENSNKSITWWVSLLLERICGSAVKDCSVCRLGWKKAENKEPNMSYRWEKPVTSTQEDLLTWRETEGDGRGWESCNCGFVWRCKTNM